MMKLVRLGLAVLAVSMVFTASAQIVRVPGRGSQMAGTNSQGIAAVQQDLIVAVRSMESALPIYDGDRIKSIRLAHRALMMIDRAMYGAKATLRQPTKARDNISSKLAHSQYSAAQIQSSQAAMNQGFQALVAAQNDLKQAVNNNPGKKGVEVYNLIQQSGMANQKALSIHGGFTAVQG